jgi:hypothetical protein
LQHDAARHRRNHAFSESPRRFDKRYFESCPYLDRHIPFARTPVRNVLKHGGCTERNVCNAGSAGTATAATVFNLSAHLRRIAWDQVTVKIVRGRQRPDLVLV